MPSNDSAQRAAPRIYLAGPDVFRADCAPFFAALSTACKRLHLVAVPPSDGNLPHGFDGDDQAHAQRIYDDNIALIKTCDGVIANLAPFRGLEPDSGTVFEVGFAVALGLPVVGYGIPASTYAQRVGEQIECQPDAQGVLRERASGLMVEGLGQRANLMLTRSVLALADDAEDALARLARHFRVG
ncbi:nucleoside 2-deoxyribosyltransferase [Variovorax dokdonensis]|uniref:Nucleoside 2-deoxyribosyltransferase n=1 Tax=Variovorax dokdonensis TaxID=344883 RepID=A0ABT7ND30_9BURK|nr:nucleoside 2-deoxyribosyltransferase [Variovorax dokdonensis]MDM0045866.1 nucleoside 2-deoxyribosyltransferase [Variovorax dokdonensis]